LSQQFQDLSAQQDNKDMMEGNTMTQIVVENLDPTLLAKLTSRSQRHRRSLNEELIAILENAVQGEGVAREVDALEAEEKLAQARAKYTNRIFDDSSKLIREDRER